VAVPSKVLEDILKLPRADREWLAEALLHSLDEDADVDEQAPMFATPEIEAAWTEELKRRIEANEPGIPFEDVMAELRAKLRSGT
jgi:putative addiction module component (TIGR02574 family)